MKGYWKEPEETADAIRDGWLYTGDLATVNSENYLLIVDRKKDMIIRGGENIASIEIERILYSHPAVLECAVIAVPDSRWGECPVAFVVFRAGYSCSSDILIQYCRSHLASFKIPDRIIGGTTGQHRAGRIVLHHVQGGGVPSEQVLHAPGDYRTRWWAGSAGRWPRRD
jgi:acyl-CoA synthetase (AMP-forming)/AMP-acid ligase II